MIYVIATLRVRNDHRDAFLRDAQPLIAATREEPGCIFYDLAQSITEPARFTFVERWDSREALDAHFETSHIRHWRELCTTYVAETALEIIRPAQVDGR